MSSQLRKLFNSDQEFYGSVLSYERQLGSRAASRGLSQQSTQSDSIQKPTKQLLVDDAKKYVQEIKDLTNQPPSTSPSKSGNEEEIKRLSEILKELQQHEVSYDVLSASKIGKTISRLTRGFFGDEGIGIASSLLIENWKKAVKNGASTAPKPTVSSVKTEKSTGQSSSPSLPSGRHVFQKLKREARDQEVNANSNTITAAAPPLISTTLKSKRLSSSLTSEVISLRQRCQDITKANLPTSAEILNLLSKLQEVQPRSIEELRHSSIIQDVKVIQKAFQADSSIYSAFKVLLKKWKNALLSLSANGADGASTVTDSSPARSSAPDSPTRPTKKRRKSSFTAGDMNEDDVPAPLAPTYVERGVYCTKPALPKRESQQLREPGSVLLKLPLPTGAGADYLKTGDDFRIPYGIVYDCYREMMIHATRFTGERTVQQALQEFTLIKKNIYVHRKRRALEDDDISVCSCTPKGEEYGCQDDCVNRMLLIECCPQFCRYGLRCCNQRLQRRMYAKTKVVDMGKKGVGVIALQGITPGQLVHEYVGEVITEQISFARQQEYANEVHKYFMTLTEGEVIDATRYSGTARFINHSCNPNCETQKWTVSGETRIGIFCIKPIETGEEITFDYRFQRFGKDKQPCYCGAPQCSGWIGSTQTSSSKKEARLSATAAAALSKQTEKLPQAEDGREVMAKEDATTSLPQKPL